MQVDVVNSKIHRVKVTGADLNYIGSTTIDENLMAAANSVRGKKVQVVNTNNGERLEPYTLPGRRGFGELTFNGAAARKVVVGDVVMVIAYICMDGETATCFNSALVFPHEATNLLP